MAAARTGWRAPGAEAVAGELGDQDDAELDTGEGDSAVDVGLSGRPLGGRGSAGLGDMYVLIGPASPSGAGVAGRVGWGFGTPHRGYAPGPAGRGISAKGGGPNLGHTRLGSAGGWVLGHGTMNTEQHVYERQPRVWP